MDNNINTLDELYKGCCMGIDALDFIFSKVEDNSFKEVLEKQKLEYEEFEKEISSLYSKYSKEDIHKTNLATKAMTWYGIEKDTMFDTSISNIADLFIRGTNMGIVEGRKLLNNKTMDKKVHKICSDYVKMQERYLDKLKDYL